MRIRLNFHRKRLPTRCASIAKKISKRCCKRGGERVIVSMMIIRKLTITVFNDLAGVQFI